MIAKLARGLGYKHGLDLSRAVKHEPAVGSFTHTSPAVVKAYQAGVEWWAQDAEMRRMERGQ